MNNTKSPEAAAARWFESVRLLIGRGYTPGFPYASGVFSWGMPSSEPAGGEKRCMLRTLFTASWGGPAGHESMACLTLTLYSDGGIKVSPETSVRHGVTESGEACKMLEAVWARR